MHRVHLTMRTEGITAFSNRYGVVVWTGENDTKTISVDANLLKRSKTAPFSFKNGLVWTGPYLTWKETKLVLLSLAIVTLKSAVPESTK